MYGHRTPVKREGEPSVIPRLPSYYPDMHLKHATRKRGRVRMQSPVPHTETSGAFTPGPVPKFDCLQHRSCSGMVSGLRGVQPYLYARSLGAVATRPTPGPEARL